MCNYLKPALGALAISILSTMVGVAAPHLSIRFPQPSCVCPKGAKRESALLGFHTLGVSNIPGAHNG
jgi:hypothetical protein